MRSLLILAALPLTALALPGRGGRCNSGRGVCQDKSDCPGGPTAEMWWSGHCSGRWVCCEPPADGGEACFRGKGICAPRSSCPGGEEAGNWWSGFCKGSSFCCKPSTDGGDGGGASQEDAAPPAPAPGGGDEDSTPAAPDAPDGSEAPDGGDSDAAPAPTVDLTTDPVTGLKMDFLYHIKGTTPPLLAPTSSDAHKLPSAFWPGTTFNLFVKTWVREFSHWVEYLTRTQDEATRTNFWTTTNNAMINHWSNSLAEIGRSPTIAEKARRVHGLTQLIQYREDALSFNLPDFWSTPGEIYGFFESEGTAYGDCEDYSNVRYLSLRKLGVPAAAMRIVVIVSPVGPHAVLVVNTEDGIVLLDNLSENPIPLTIPEMTKRRYRPVYSVNEEGSWLHQGVARSDVQDLLLSLHGRSRPSGSDLGDGSSRGGRLSQPRNEYRSPFSAGTNELGLNFGPQDTGARLAARSAVERALATYAIGSTARSLPYARLVGINAEQVRLQFASLWTMVAYHTVVNMMIDALVTFDPSEDQAIPTFPSQNHKEMADDYLLKLSEHVGGKFAKITKRLGATGILQASFLFYIELTAFEVARAAPGTSPMRSSRRADVYGDATTQTSGGLWTKIVSRALDKSTREDDVRLAQVEKKPLIFREGEGPTERDGKRSNAGAGVLKI